jgi:hypothetical protein
VIPIAIGLTVFLVGLTLCLPSFLQADEDLGYTLHAPSDWARPECRYRCGGCDLYFDTASGLVFHAFVEHEYESI